MAERCGKTGSIHRQTVLYMTPFGGIADKGTSGPVSVFVYNEISCYLYFWIACFCSKIGPRGYRITDILVINFGSSITFIRNEVIEAIIRNKNLIKVDIYYADKEHIEKLWKYLNMMVNYAS